jgi:WD40 repeat protein
VSPDQRLAVFSLRSLANVRTPDAPEIVAVETSGWKVVHAYPMLDGATALNLFAGGREIVAGSFNGEVETWDLSSNQPPRRLTAFPGGRGAPMVEAVAGSPDGRLIFAGGGSGIPAVVLRSSDGAKVATFPYGADQEIRQAAWDPKGRYLAILDNGNNLVLWRPESPTASYVKIALPGLQGTMASFAISPDGAHLAAWAGNGVVIFSVR